MANYNLNYFKLYQPALLLNECLEYILPIETVDMNNFERRKRLLKQSITNGTFATYLKVQGESGAKLLKDITTFYHEIFEESSWLKRKKDGTFSCDPQSKAKVISEIIQLHSSIYLLANDVFASGLENNECDEELVDLVKIENE